jgi:hypothetical protein
MTAQNWMRLGQRGNSNSVRQWPYVEPIGLQGKIGFETFEHVMLDIL